MVAARTLELVATHTGSDFDAFSSLVAATKLHPGARPVLTGGLNRNVREFLSLYMHDSDFLKGRDVDLDTVATLVVVDTQYPARLGVLGPLLARPELRRILWDHHPLREDLGDVAPGAEVHVEEVGATVSLLVDEIRRRGLAVTPLEATLFSLGIYEDTGCLLFRSTAEVDLESVLWLRRQGADVRIVSSFLQRALTHEQRQVLDDLMKAMTVERIRGFSVAMAGAVSSGYVEDLDVVVNRVRELQRADAWIVAVTMKEKTTYVIGRSRVEQVDVARALAPLGGGGHLFAASASVHDATAEEALARCREALRQNVRPQLTAAEIMSHPVRTIPLRTTVTAAQRLMVSFGYNGLPVVDGDAVVGVVTRRETENAMRHGLGHAPVAGYMTRHVVTAPSTTPLQDLQRLLIEHNVGRIPVVDEGRLVGIVTTNDLLRALHRSVTLPRLGYRLHEGEAAAEPPIHPTARDCSRLLRERLRDGIEDFLRHLGATADAEGLRVYLVGGSVRDLILGRRSKDLDVVVERDALAFASRVADGCPVPYRLTPFPRYRTASLALDSGWRCDMVTARREFYPGPAQPPEVDLENVRLDLYRRDFTVNAMAVSLNAEDWGTLLDYYGGRRDLDRGILRILHPLSFVEDPTRVFRALRFMVRFGFTLEAGTAGHLKQSLADGALGFLAAPVLSRELDETLALDDAMALLKALDSLALLPSLLWPGRTGRLGPSVYRRALRVRRLARRLAGEGEEPSGRTMVLPLVRILLADGVEARETYVRRCTPSARRIDELAAADDLAVRLRRWFEEGCPVEALPRLRAGASRPVLVAAAGDACRSPADEATVLRLLRP